MKEMKLIALTSIVMAFKNNLALSTPNCNNTLVISWLLGAPQLYAP